jgi:hypothetical protein
MSLSSGYGGATNVGRTDQQPCLDIVWPRFTVRHGFQKRGYRISFARSKSSGENRIHSRRPSQPALSGGIDLNQSSGFSRVSEVIQRIREGGGQGGGGQFTSMMSLTPWLPLCHVSTPFTGFRFE